MISSTTGVSSRISSTRLPAAKVFCRVLPNAARAITGPKEENSASVGIKTPSKSTAPLWYSKAEANSMIRSNVNTTVLVTAVFRPAVRFIFSSSRESSSVFSFILERRFFPCPYWRISESPRRLSSTKPESSPDLVRKRSPSSPLHLDITIGITIPTIR